jgi:hypothetical protein
MGERVELLILPISWGFEVMGLKNERGDRPSRGRNCESLKIKAI